MKLPNFLESPRLNGLRFRMGATLATSYVVRRVYQLLDPAAIERLGREGLDVNVDEIVVQSDHTLAFKGRRVVVYIRDVSSRNGRFTLPKFHVVSCRTLEEMRRQRRFERYVVATRDDGLFQINFIEESARPSLEKLSVCQNCLEFLAWNGFGLYLSSSERATRVSSFRTSEFFEKFPKDLITEVPTYSSEEAPVNNYSDDWGMVSEGLKQRRGYVCESCSRRLVGSDAYFLHVHHKNGLKNDNSDSNLEVLCIGCHAEAPMHTHMKALPDYKEFAERFMSGV